MQFGLNKGSIRGSSVKIKDAGQRWGFCGGKAIGVHACIGGKEGEEMLSLIINTIDWNTIDLFEFVSYNQMLLSNLQHNMYNFT